jgi:hypothetical protein
MAHRAISKPLFSGLVVLNIGIASAVVLMVGDVTRTGRSQDVAAVLACAAAPTDTIFVSNAYPYDLPFYTQTRQQMRVLENWPELRKRAGDGWQRELFEGADFDAEAAKALQSADALASAGTQAGNWFVTRSSGHPADNPPGWTLHFQGAGWALYKSGLADSATKSPEPAEHKGLPGCKNKSDK